MATASGDVVVVRHSDGPTRWPVDWSAVWVGTLAALATALIIALAGAAWGAHQLGPAQRIASWRDVGLGALIFGVLGAFFSFVVGGWIAGKISGYRRAEPCMLHGAISWLLAVPILVVLAALGAGSYFGGWYGGLAGTPVWATPGAVTADPAAATAARNGALGAVTTLLIGLIGSVLGGWLASGEPMSVYHYRTRDATRAAPVTATTATRRTVS